MVKYLLVSLCMGLVMQLTSCSMQQKQYVYPTGLHLKNLDLNKSGLIAVRAECVGVNNSFPRFESLVYACKAHFRKIDNDPASAVIPQNFAVSFDCPLSFNELLEFFSDGKTYTVYFKDRDSIYYISNGENNKKNAQLNESRSDLIVLAQAKELIQFNPQGSGGIVFTLKKSIKGDFNAASFTVVVRYDKDLMDAGDPNSKKFQEAKKRADMILYKGFQPGKIYSIGFHKCSEKDKRAYISDTNWELNNFVRIVDNE